MTSSRSAVLGLVALLCGGALLAFGFTKPPVGMCDPVLGPAGIAIALGCGLLGLSAVALRKAGAPAAALGAALGAWTLVAAAALAARTCAGKLPTLQAMDVAVAVMGALAVTLLVAGLSAKAADRGAFAVAAVVVVAAAAGLGASHLSESRSRDRAWLSWARLHDAAEALSAGPAPPGDDAELAFVIAALPAELREGLATDDAWGRPLRYSSSGGSWRVTSLGSDGERGPYSEGPSRDFADDLVVSDEGPVAWPESPCTGTPRQPPKPKPVDLRGR